MPEDLFTIADIDTDLLAKESVRVRSLLAASLPQAEIVEVGSTAIPGLVGKGDLDILVRVAPADFAFSKDVLDGLLSPNLHQHADSGFQGYIVTSPIDVAVQLTVRDGPQDHFTDFLAILRANPAVVQAYNKLKFEWNGRPMAAYRAAKEQFIRHLLGQRK